MPVSAASARFTTQLLFSRIFEQVSSSRVIVRARCRAVKGQDIFPEVENPQHPGILEAAFGDLCRRTCSRTRYVICAPEGRTQPFPEDSIPPSAPQLQTNGIGTLFCCGLGVVFAVDWETLRQQLAARAGISVKRLLYGPTFDSCDPGSPSREVGDSSPMQSPFIGEYGRTTETASGIRSWRILNLELRGPRPGPSFHRPPALALANLNPVCAIAN